MNPKHIPPNSPAALALSRHHGRRLTLQELDEHLQIRDLSLELIDEVGLHLERVDDLAHGGVDLGLQLFLAEADQVVRVQVQARFELIWIRE